MSARPVSVTEWWFIQATIVSDASVTGPPRVASHRYCSKEADHRGLYRLPDHLSLDVAAFAEPLAVGMHAVDQADVEIGGEGVAVFGCGPIGLAAIATLIDRGHHDVVGIDMSPTRLELALSLGARAALDPASTDVWDELASIHGTMRFAGGRTTRTSAFIEASGSSRVISEVLERGPVGGRLSVVGVHYQPVPTNYLLVLMKEFTIRGSIEYPPRFADAVDLLGRRDLSALITHRFPLSQVHAAIESVRGSSQCGKVMVVMGSPD